MDVTRNMKYWENMAENIGLPRREIKYFTERFEKGIEFQYGSGLHRWVKPIGLLLLAELKENDYSIVEGNEQQTEEDLNTDEVGFKR